MGGWREPRVGLRQNCHRSRLRRPQSTTLARIHRSDTGTPPSPPSCTDAPIPLTTASTLQSPRILSKLAYGSWRSRSDYSHSCHRTASDPVCSLEFMIDGTDGGWKKRRKTLIESIIALRTVCSERRSRDANIASARKLSPCTLALRTVLCNSTIHWASELRQESMRT